MLDPINEMRKLKCKSCDELMQIATTKYGFCPDGTNVSKVELITYIITLATMRGDVNIVAPQENKNDNKRTRYCLREYDDTKHYVMLTPEQERFMQWNYDNAISYDGMNIDEIKDINWEMP